MREKDHKQIENNIEKVITQSWQKQKAISDNLEGSFVPEPIQNLLNQLEETFEQYKNDPEFIKKNTNIIWKTILVGNTTLLMESLRTFRWGKILFEARRLWIT